VVSDGVRPPELYDLSDGHLLAQLDVAAWAVAVAPGGGHLATSDDDGYIRIRDLATGATRTVSAEMAGDPPAFLGWYGNDVVGVTNSQTGKDILVWDGSNGSIAKSHSLCSPCEVRQVRVDPADGTVLIAYDKTVGTYNISDGDPVRVLPSTPDMITAAATSDLGRQFLTAGADGRIVVWEFQTPEVSQATFELLGHRGPVLSAAFFGDQQSIVSLGTDGTVRLWRLPSVDRSLAQTDWVGPMDTSSDGQWFASVSRDETVRIFRPGDLATVATIPVTSPQDVRFNPEDAHIVYTLGTNDAAPEEWQWSDDGQVTSVKDFEGTSGPSALSNFDISGDGSTLVGGDWSGYVHLWDTATGKLRHAPPGLDQPGTAITDVRFDPAVVSGDRLAIATDRGVSVRSLTSQTSPLVLLDTNVASVVFDRHGQHIAVSENGGTIKNWTSDGKLIDTLLIHGGRASTPRFNDAGTLEAFGTAEGLIEVQNVASGRTVMLSRVHGGSVNDVAFVPGDDNHIVSTSDDATVARSSCAACTNPDAVIADARAWVDANPDASP
jgi:WD40 repeat protein